MAPATDTVVTSEYVVGDVVDHSWGLATLTLAVKSLVFDAAIDLSVAVARPTSTPAASRTELTIWTACSVAASCWTVTATFTVASLVEILGVVTCTPVYATCTELTTLSQTRR